MTTEIEEVWSRLHTEERPVVELTLLNFKMYHATLHLPALHSKRQPSHLASQPASISSAVQVRVVLRVDPPLPEGRGQPPVLRVDRSRKRVTVMEPVGRGQPRMSTMTLDRDGKNLFRTFNVDAAFPPESSQVRPADCLLFAARSLGCVRIAYAGHQS